MAHAWGANAKIDNMGIAMGDDLDLGITHDHSHNILRNAIETGTPCERTGVGAMTGACSSRVR